MITSYILINISTVNGNPVNTYQKITNNLGEAIFKFKMNNEMILAKLTDVFKEVFDLDDVVITRETVSDDIEDWDSLEHINLISAVESTFKMKFKMKEVSTMKNVGEMIDIIAERTKL